MPTVNIYFEENPELESLIPDLKQFIAEMVDGIDLSGKEKALEKSKKSVLNMGDVSKKFKISI